MKVNGKYTYALYPILLFSQIQEWVAPPIASAGQLPVPKVPRSGAQVACSTWTPRGSVCLQDDYDDDPMFFDDSSRDETHSCDTQRKSCSESEAESEGNVEEKSVESSEDEVNQCGMVGSNSCRDSPMSTPDRLKPISGVQLISIEESLHQSMDKGSPFIQGPFGARRICYHCRPQVKRCATSWCRYHSRRVLPATSISVYHQSTHSNTSSSINPELSHKFTHALKSLSSRRHSLSKACSSFTYSRACSRILEGNIPHRFSCLTRKKNIEWKAPRHPCTYERVLWRLPSPIWRQLELCLTYIEDKDTLHFLTPVMYSLRRFTGMSGSRLAYSLSRDSYGVTERAGEDLVTAMCLCCVLLFLCRLYQGFNGCLAHLLHAISWE